jgi:hypothetical protein
MFKLAILARRNGFRRVAWWLMAKSFGDPRVRSVEFDIVDGSRNEVSVQGVVRD